MSAINIIGTGVVSASSASVAPPRTDTQPAAPMTVEATPDGSTEIELEWSAVTDTAEGASPVTGYKIEYSEDNMLPWMDVATTTVTGDVVTDTKYSDTGLAPDTTRFYRVSAISLAGRVRFPTGNASRPLIWVRRTRWGW